MVMIHYNNCDAYRRCVRQGRVARDDFSAQIYFCSFINKSCPAFNEKNHIKNEFFPTC